MPSHCLAGATVEKGNTMFNKNEAMHRCARYFMDKCQEYECTATEMLDDVRKMADWLPYETQRDWYLYTLETRWSLMWQQWFVMGEWVPYTSDMWEMAHQIFGEFNEWEYTDEHMRRLIGQMFADAMMPAVYDRFNMAL